MTAGRNQTVRLALFVALSCCETISFSTISFAATADSSVAAEVAKPTDSPSRAATQPDATRPGLVAEYRSLLPAGDVSPLLRVDAKPAFTWGTSSPHPRIPSGPFQVVWTGWLQLKEADSIRFSAFLGGELKLVVDGIEILKSKSNDSSRRIESNTPLRREAGHYPLEIHYQSLPNTPARIQLWWEGKSFSAAPLPASNLRHAANAVLPRLRTQEILEEGRELVREFSCARCHAAAFPSAAAAPPGPSLENLPSRLQRDWLVAWLANPGQLRSHARMPKLFAPDRRGFVEISLISDYLLRGATREAQRSNTGLGDHRAGRQAFVGLGCAACHLLPEPSESTPPRLDEATAAPDEQITRTAFQGLADRFTAEQLTEFIANPLTRFPDGRMPRLPMEVRVARDISAYLLMWSKPAAIEKSENNLPSADEINGVAENLAVGATDRVAIGAALVQRKRCVACHSGLEAVQTVQIPLRLTRPEKVSEMGCLNSDHLPYFSIPSSAREKIVGYASAAALERHASPFQERQQLLQKSGCFVCHQADRDSPPQIEAVGQTLWTPHLMRLPYQRTPRLTGAVAKYTRAHLLEAVRNGVSGVRPSWYSYRMPAFGDLAEQIIQALAERDGEPTQESAVETNPSLDLEPTLAMFGGGLVGFEGYSCVSCHIWMGREFTSVDPGAVGPELTTVTRRIRRHWFDRWLENPARMHPGTPMPAFFSKGELAPVTSVLAGDATKQKDALWAYLSQGTHAPNPQPRPSIPVVLPGASEPPLVAQIPVRLSNGETLESLCLEYGYRDLVVYDLGQATLHSFRSGSQILRNPNGWRTFSFSETDTALQLAATPAFLVIDRAGAAANAAMEFRGYERARDGAKIRFRISHAASQVEIAEFLRLESREDGRRLIREWEVTGIPSGCSIRIRVGLAPNQAAERSETDLRRATAWTNRHGEAQLSVEGTTLAVQANPDSATGSWAGGLTLKLPPASSSKVASAAFNVSAAGNASETKNSDELGRPGYRALRYSIPKTAEGEDRIMPAALAVDPKSGRLFIASLKLGELFALHDPEDDGAGAVFKDYAGGLFQDAYSMLHDGEALYVLHRRNLTRVVDVDGDGVADRFERVAALPHRAGNIYDWAYGLVRERTGDFILSFAPHGDDRSWVGMGGVTRLGLDRGKANFTEIASGLRNAFGWTMGPNDEVFFSDNQGEWVPANKLCHVMENRFYGFPNSARPETAKNPRGDTAVWVPYAWAKSINGIVYNTSGEKFGPFNNQFFMAELMHGGAIIRANVEKINGVYQGACFPFWGRGLLGPLVLAFDPKGRLFVGSITQPGWMAQPDRGALFRIEFTGDTPFEIQSIHALPSGFRLRLTKAVAAASALDPASYSLEHYRYEYTGAYGSPELDRTSVRIKQIELAGGGQTVDLVTDTLIPGRIYAITAAGIKDSSGERLVHPTGVYTLNQIPRVAQAERRPAP